MKRVVALLACLSLAACGPREPKLPNDSLDHAIGGAIGDPNTCVLVVDRKSGKTVYSYNDGFNCVRGLPACDRPGFLSARQALAFATLPDGRKASCNSVPDGSRTVGWAEGRVQSAKGDFIYSAMMEGQSALPGQEISARLDNAFSDAGL